MLVTVEDAGAVVAHPCATRISQTQEGTVEVYIPSVREAVLDRFHAVLDQWTATSAGLHVAEHTRTSGPGRPMRALPVGGVVSNRDNCGLMLLPTSTRSIGHLLHHPSRRRLGPSCTTCAGHRRVGTQTRCSTPERTWTPVTSVVGSTWRRSATRRRSGSATAVERCDPDRGRGFSGSGRSRKRNALAALDVPHPVPDAPPVDLRPEVRQR